MLQPDGSKRVPNSKAYVGLVYGGKVAQSSGMLRSRLSGHIEQSGALLTRVKDALRLRKEALRLLTRVAVAHWTAQQQTTTACRI